MNNDPWKSWQNKLDRCQAISNRRRRNFIFQMIGVGFLFIGQFLGYYFGVDSTIMAWYPLVFVIWGIPFLVNITLQGKQIQKILNEED